MDSTTVSNNPQAHHIAEGTRGPNFAKENRKILFEVCININDAVNGVWLPRRSNLDTNLLGRVYHNYTFPRNNQIRAYDEYVNKLLTPVRRDRKAIERRLKQIRKTLASGRAPWLPKDIDPTEST